MTCSSLQAGAATRSTHREVPRHVPTISAVAPACPSARAPSPARSIRASKATPGIRGELSISRTITTLYDRQHNWRTLALAGPRAGGLAILIQLTEPRPLLHPSRSRGRPRIALPVRALRPPRSLRDRGSRRQGRHGRGLPREGLTARTRGGDQGPLPLPRERFAIPCALRARGEE